jgi:beta-phosphoglucomutase
MTEPSTLWNPLPDRPRLVFRVGFAGNRVTRSREVVVNNPDRSTSGRETRRIAGVIFDMDGVLVDSEPFIAEAAVRMFAEKGVAVRPEDFRPFIGMGEDRFLGGVAESRGVVLDLPRDKVRTYEIYLELIQGRLEPLPGVANFVGRCRSLGLTLAVASSADRMKVEGNLRQIALPSGTFDAVVVGEDIIRKKPAPDIFLEAIRRLDLEPGVCLVIEDAVAGVAAAKAAGSRCLGLTTSFTTEQLKEAGADWTAPDLATATEVVLDW